MARANAFWASCAARKAQASHFHARHFSSSSARSSRFQAPGAWSFWRPRARRAPTKLQFFETQIVGCFFQGRRFHFFVERKLRPTSTSSSVSSWSLKMRIRDSSLFFNERAWRSLQLDELFSDQWRDNGSTRSRQAWNSRQYGLTLQ